MRSLLVVAGIAGCSSLAATDARHRFLSETLEEPEDVMLKTADLHANLLREPPMTIKLDNRYKFTGLGELVSQLIDHHTTLGSVGSSGTMARQKLLNYHNSQYFGEIKIGTPGRRFVVVSDEIMLPHASKMESHLNPTSGEDAHRTRSSTQSTPARFHQYGHSLEIQQSPSFNKVPNQAIGLAVEESTHPFADLPFDGLVGLGFPDVSGEEGLPSSALPIVDQMVKEKVLDRNVFSVYMSEDINREIGLHGLKINGKSFGVCEKRGCRAAVDTGSSLAHICFERYIRKARQLQPGTKGLRSGGAGCRGNPNNCAAGFMAMDVPAPRGPLFVLGNSFIRKYYSIFDRDHMVWQNPNMI
ncbi:eukaryotic aspartyl protease, putative [Eimeria necatrix]|uniref:Eukaryotic aspartyl protease, putative n=1 Tax=Eimeria necatrix TaxID=51315 RepID=U6MHZ8_9EIME|nr:eukaryotic aspartyl protease, putative [Eimeria necatrix]CDJ63887.1 eukaryotic aspartyl protease, putative [Eimeria necatrix]